MQIPNNIEDTDAYYDRLALRQLLLPSLGRGTHFAEYGNCLIFMAENENIACILTDFGHKNSGENGDITLEGRKTEIVNIIATEIGNYRS